MTIFDRIIEWNQERGLKTFSKTSEYNMLYEEMMELKDAMNDNDEEEIVDALCDLIVIATGSMYKLGYDPNIAMKETLKEIESRVGKINSKTGKWEKDKKAKTYKADYGKARTLLGD